MDIFFSALGIVLGTLYFALTGHGVLVAGIASLIISTLAFTTLKKHHVKIFSLLSFFLLMYLSFNVRQEYFEYFAKQKLVTEGQIFRVIKTKESSFFTKTIYLKPIANNLVADYLNPTLIWKTQNRKGLSKNDLISFPQKLKIQKLDLAKRELYRRDKVFSLIKNTDFNLEGIKTSKIGDLQKHIKRYFHENLKPQNSELALGLILGSRNSDINKKTLNSIRNLGLGHFFSASGFHLIILLLIIFWISKQVPFISKIETPLAISFILAYMAIINFSPSITRAGLMAIAFLLFKGVNRKINRAKLLAILAAIILLIDPHTAFDLGFQLSYLATLGIILWFEDLDNKLKNIIKIKWLREILAISLSTQVLLFPLIIYYFSNLQIWSLLANIIFTPILSLITVLSFTGICFLLDPILSFLSYIFDLSQKLPLIKTQTELDFTSLILIWITNISLLTFLLKDFKTNSKNIVIEALSSKHVQLSITASAFLLFLASSMPPLYIQELKIKNAKIQNKDYKKLFEGDFDYKYFDIKGHKALIINKLPSIEVIKNDIYEVNFLFIPKLNNSFIYLDRLIHFLKPQITVIKARSETDKVKLNLDLIASETNTLYDSGHIYLSKNKYWKITN